ncbi:actin-5c-like protein [Anaeramoeba flamelloides]|uniref:Actin-5c-like protein n=1 Tax=Anaeramoeba flamelloides TaxID=1746091 RepID=A0AAV8ABE4_9EUKA|nr:actin-5c-like protein [Anaeramoeba flamelloides]
MESDTIPIIIDSGSKLTKAGLANGVQPKVVFPSIVGRERQRSVYIKSGQKSAYVGKEAIIKRGILNKRYPIIYGSVYNWDDMEKLWHHIFYDALKVPPEEHPFLLTVKPLTPSDDLRKTCQIMFETFNAPSLCLGNNASLSLFGANKTTGLVLQMGSSLNYAVPIVESQCLKSNIGVSGLGGILITEHLNEILATKGIKYFSHQELEHVRLMKEQYCSVLPIQKKEQNNLELNESDHNFIKNQKAQLFDSTEFLSIDEKIVFCTEPLFSPQYAEKTIHKIQKSNDFSHLSKKPNFEIGLHQLCIETIHSLPKEKQEIMFQNILLAGGHSMFKGFSDRLSNELLSFFAESKQQINIIAPESRQFSSWLGAKKFASLNNFHDFCLTMDDYDENGPYRGILKFNL